MMAAMMAVATSESLLLASRPSTSRDILLLSELHCSACNCLSQHTKQKNFKLFRRAIEVCTHALIAAAQRIKFVTE